MRLGLACLIALALSTATAQEPAKPPVAELLEDDAEGLLKQLTNPTGDPGEGHVERTAVFSGKQSIRIAPMQRFHSRIPGWSYKITEKPKPGEYRYLRFAWKADGCAGIMLQMHDETDWHIRYTAGVDRYSWGTKFVAEKPPADWTVVTCDLFKDFGERTITGIALTAFDGRAAYFDHIYFGRTIEDLDRIDATGLRKGLPLVLGKDRLESLWTELSGTDAAKAYLALWTLVAAPEHTVPFLRAKLIPPKAGDGSKVAKDIEQIRRWIRELDDDAFEVREAASRQLQEHLDQAAVLLEQEVERTASPEVRVRIQRLLRTRKDDDKNRQRIEQAVRALEYMATSGSKRCLEELAQASDRPRAAAAAKAALGRLPQSPAPSP